MDADTADRDIPSVGADSHRHLGVVDFDDERALGHKDADDRGDEPGDARPFGQAETAQGEKNQGGNGRRAPAGPTAVGQGPGGREPRRLRHGIRPLQVREMPSEEIRHLGR